jgi:hypothetical protein
MIAQGSLELPENAPKKGQQWSNSVEVNNPMAGKQIVKTTYTYDGTKEVDGVTHAVFRPTIEMSFEGAQATIGEQDSKGEILFNVAEGRLDSSNLQQKVTINQPGGAQAKIDQKVDVKVKPAGESESESAATEKTN